MEGDWGHNFIMLTDNSNANFVFVHVLLLHAMSLYSMTIRLSYVRIIIDYLSHFNSIVTSHLVT